MKTSNHLATPGAAGVERTPRPTIHCFILSLPAWQKIGSKVRRTYHKAAESECQRCGNLVTVRREDVVHVVSWRNKRKKAGKEIPLYAVNRSHQRRAVQIFEGRTEFKEESDVIAMWDGQADTRPRFFCKPGPEGDFVTEVKCMVYDPGIDSFARVEAIFESRKLSGKTITIFGMGCFGSFIAEQLARCGADRFRLIDFDRLEPQNLARHIGLPKDLGRYKTHVVRERLREINPHCQVQTNEKRLLDREDELEASIEGASLALDCTDSDLFHFVVNECCLRQGVTAIYGGAYERAFGGMVMRVVPGKTPCFDCVIGGLWKALGKQVETMPRGEIPYSEIQNADEYKAEPGLGVDAHMIALIQAKMALVTLLRGGESKLQDFPEDFLLWGNQAEWIFPEPLYCKFAKTTFRKDCYTCRKINVSQEEYERDREQVDQLWQELPYDPDLLPV